MPSKKELKRAEALRREKQREEAMRKKQGWWLRIEWRIEKEVEETPVVEEPKPVVEKWVNYMILRCRKRERPNDAFVKSIWVIILAIVVYLFREEIAHAFKEIISSLHWYLYYDTLSQDSFHNKHPRNQ